MRSKTALVVFALALLIGGHGAAMAACPTGTIQNVSTMDGTPAAIQQGIKIGAMVAQTFKVPLATESCRRLLGLTLVIRKDEGGNGNGNANANQNGGSYGDVIVTVFNTNAGQPSTPVPNASAVISAGSINSEFEPASVQFSNPPSLVSGELYAIVVTSPNSSGSKSYKLGGSTNNPYADGRSWHRGSTLDPWGGNSAHDAQIEFCFGPCSSGCTFTQGYWKTHGPIPTGNNTNVWPVTSLTLGTVSYTDSQLQSIFDTPAAGNGLITLAHQLIAAKLNIANGADGSAVAGAIAAADAAIGNLMVPPVGSGSLAPNVTSSLAQTLTDYNEGTTGPGHCQ